MKTKRYSFKSKDCIAALFVLLLALLIFGGRWIAPYSATAFSAEHSLQAPGWPFLFGTDEFGRDVVSRIICGAAPTVSIAVASAVLGVALGTATGLVCAYFGGIIDEILMRLMDTLMSFPSLVLAMLIVVMAGGSELTVILAIGVVFWPRSSRLMRSSALTIARRDYIAAAHTRGESAFYIVFREMLPNLARLLVVDLSLRVTYGVLLAASLSYLGIGVAPPTPAWGLMAHDGQAMLQIAPWLVIAPCAAIGVVAIGAVLLGERIRHAAAPDTRRIF